MISMPATSRACAVTPSSIHPPCLLLDAVVVVVVVVVINVIVEVTYRVLSSTIDTVDKEVRLALSNMSWLVRWSAQLEGSATRRNKGYVKTPFGVDQRGGDR
jgi:hypothetical protein